MAPHHCREPMAERLNLEGLEWNLNYTLYIYILYDISDIYIYITITIKYILGHFANIVLTSFLFWCGFMCWTIGGGFWTYRLQSTEHVCGCPSLTLTEDQCKPKPSTLWRDSSTPDESLQDFQVVSPRVYFKSSFMFTISGTLVMMI